jgi:hypothetical protein
VEQPSQEQAEKLQQYPQRLPGFEPPEIPENVLLAFELDTELDTGYTLNY